MISIEVTYERFITINKSTKHFKRDIPLHHLFIMNCDSKALKTSETEVQKELKLLIENATLFYSGSLKTEFNNYVIGCDMLNALKFLSLTSLSCQDRLDVMETLIKSGNFEAVKYYWEKLEASNLSQGIVDLNNDIINIWGCERPIFWLAAIVTRWDLNRVPEENYKQIENYLCHTANLCPNGLFLFDGEIINRDEYVKIIDDWKKQQPYYQRLKQELNNVNQI